MPNKDSQVIGLVLNQHDMPSCLLQPVVGDTVSDRIQMSS
jgi:hypothetical protein